MKRLGITVLTILAIFAAGPAPAEARPRKGVGRGRDTRPPTLVCPTGITVDAMAPIGAYVAYSVTVTDDTDPSPEVTCSHPSGSTFPIGTTTVTVTATDWRRNSTTCTFDVTVLPPTVSSFSYRMDWLTWDAQFNDVVWFAWTITVAADGSVSGSGEQLYLLEDYPEWLESYAAPMPAGLTGSGAVSGAISPDGSSTLDVSFNYWSWISGDYDGSGNRLYTETTYDFSGATQASLDAAGNLVFSGGYGAVWRKA